jgi:hypothetical protein
VTATADGNGRYTLRTIASARLEANSPSGFGAADADDGPDDAQIDIVVHANEFRGRPLGDDEPDESGPSPDRHDGSQDDHSE